MSDQDALLRQILSGENPTLQKMAASGMVPLAPEQLVPIQVALAEGTNPEVASAARDALNALEPRLAIEFLRHQGQERELAWFARHVRQPQIIDAIVRRQDVPRPLLVELAATVWPEAQEAMLLRQDAIVEAPEILVALEKNPQLSSYAKRRIWEYREHLLPRDKVPPKKAEEILAEADAWTDKEVKEAIDEARDKPGEGEDVDAADGLNVGQVKGLPVPVRIRLARTADRTLRGIFARDSSAQVALAILVGNRVGEQEAEVYANSRSVHADLLGAISKRREWIRRYPVAKALAKNPRIHIATAIRLLSRMTLGDLRLISRDRNVPQAVRMAALRLYQAKR